MKHSSKFSAHLIVHNDFKHIYGALESLYATYTQASSVYVTINSGDVNAVESLRHAFPETQITVNATPKGFATNHNDYMRKAETEYLGLLNDDIVLHPAALEQLIAYLDKHSDVALVGPNLQNPDGTPQTSVYSDPGLARVIYRLSGLAFLTRQDSAARRTLQKLGINRLLKLESLNHSVTRTVPVVKGAVMIVRRAAYLEAGGMDEATLATGEEIDWHLRMRQAGWKVAFVAEAHVTHFGSGQARLQTHGPMLVEDRKALLNYWLKHKPVRQTLLLRFSIFMIHAIYSLMLLTIVPERAKWHWRCALLGLTWTRG